jgi:DNA-binding beta-propeller fold protein YncE
LRGLRDTGIAMAAGAWREPVGRWVRLSGVVASCLTALAWLAPAALATDSIYWGSYQPNGGIRIGSLDGTGARDLVAAESSPEGIAIDPAAGKMYWADTTSGAIRVANLDGSGARDLYTGETQPSGVAIDPAAGKIYWANAVSRTGAIRVGNLDGSGVRDLFSNESYPVGVVIDPAAGTIYWGSYDTFKIRLGNLDGTGARDLFTGENYPTGIVIDPGAAKIYWADEFAGTIRVGNLDGTGATNLFTGEGGIGGLALDPGTGKLYWGDFPNETVRVGNANGTGTPQTVFSGEPNAWFVALLRAPAGTSAPQVTGSGTPGTPLSCSQGTWAGDVPNMLFYRAPSTFAYQWYVNGASISGATATTYTPTAVGKYTCQVTASNQAGSTSQTSTAGPAITSTASIARSSTTAGFSGSVNPEGLPTTAHFEYGLDPRYTASGGLVYDHSTQAQSVGADFSSHTITVSQSGLVPNALYHVRLVATNSAGTTFGPDVTFLTKKDPTPNAPSIGKSFNVSATGVVLIKLHGEFVPLTELRQIPAGTLVNALHGTLKLTTAAPASATQHATLAGKRKTKKRAAKTQTATFGGAVFKVTQVRSGASKGLATVSVVEGAFKGAPSFASCKTHKGKASATAVSNKVLQLLHASGHGKFRTKGRYAAATVRGTIWTTADRCDGTLIHAIKDSVSVNDLVRHKTSILHAGHSYLALAKPLKKHK